MPRSRRRHADPDAPAGISRRSFLIGGAAAAGLALGLWRLRARRATPPAPEPGGATLPAAPPYGDWRDVYRERWRWDRISRGTHTSANCVAACAWNLYVRDGVVWREEQSAPYTASNQTLPDWNPRGCQKGACYSDLSLGPSRIRYPLRRVGPRGGGRWKRIGWDEALDEVSETLVDVLAERGGSGTVCEVGGNLDFGPTFVSFARFFRQIGGPITDPNAMVGDLPVGGTITLGEPMSGGSSDDWFRSSYLVLWAFNPSSTRIPDAHFLNEARYRGARVVAVAPDLNQSAIHTDLWLPVRPGSDAALALAACHVVVEEGLHDADYLREQTDLPLLVLEESGRFLRESDLKRGGSDEIFALWDEVSGGVVWAPGCAGSGEKTLSLPKGMRPALELRSEVRLASGDSAAVRTVYAALRERLRDYAPEAAARITGVSAPAIRRFAREFAAAPAALILSEYGMCKNYHSDLAQRSQILLASLTGNLGRAGGGWRSGAYVPLDGFALMSMQDELDIPHLVWLGVQSALRPKQVMERFLTMFIPATVFHAVHGGLAEVQTRAEYADPLLPGGAAPHLEEAVSKGHFPVGAPPEEGPPDFILNVCGNVLRHSRMGNRLRDGLFARARMVVDVSFRMSETARHADLILPAAGWYEKVGFKYIPAYVPYVHLADRAVAPEGESKPEWEIFGLLAERVGAAARRRGIGQVTGFRGDTCDISRLGERFSDGGRFGPGDEHEAMEFILQVSSQSRGLGADDLRARGGAIRVKALGGDNGAGIHSEYSETEPIAPLRDNLEAKKPYPTLTGRQQFYVDHPWFLELDEALPAHKAPPAAGGDHPFTMTGGHTRWSIHAIWRDHSLMLRLQRGEPLVFLNQGDADARGIGDHDWVRVWNDIGRFEARAALSGAIRPGQVHIFHAWEPYQFRSEESHQSLIPSPLKVTQLVGDYGHLHWSYAHYEPNQVDRDTRVDVAKA
jgi:DMSO reductase family type II enzyme molybdopterin subunit